MLWNMRLRMLAIAYLLVLLDSQGTAISQERSQLVDTGVILSPSKDERPIFFGITPPFWTPSPEQIAQIEAQLKPYLEGSHQGKWIAELGIYKRQYVGYTADSRRWVFVNSFCERFWKRRTRHCVRWRTLFPQRALRPVDRPVRPATNQWPLEILTATSYTRAAQPDLAAPHAKRSTAAHVNLARLQTRRQH